MSPIMIQSRWVWRTRAGCSMPRRASSAGFSTDAATS
jgi:hypothetical protein